MTDHQLQLPVSPSTGRPFRPWATLLALVLLLLGFGAAAVALLFGAWVPGVVWLVLAWPGMLGGLLLDARRMRACTAAATPTWAFVDEFDRTSS